jgi:cytochrome c556
MYSKKILGFLITFGLAVPALAHQGAKGDVKIRMESMKTMGKSMKTLASMEKGDVMFDAELAEEARLFLLKEAKEIEENFKNNPESNISEASPDIWSNWDDFLEKGKQLEIVAKQVKFNSIDDVRQGLGKLGGACKACHQDYKIN